MPANIRSVIVELFNRLSGRGLSQRDVLRKKVVPHGAISKVLRRAHETGRTPQGLYSLRRRRLTGIGIPMVNLRRSDDRLRFIKGIPILIRRRLLSE